MTGAPEGRRGGAKPAPPRLVGTARWARPFAGRAAVASVFAAGVFLAGISMAPGSPPPAGADSPQIVRVEMTEFAFRPAVISVAAGRAVRLRFENRGQLAHQFQAQYHEALPVRVVDESTLVEAPGATFVRLEPAAAASIEFYPTRRGRFAFACTIEGHKEAGMRGTLEVK